MSKIQKLINKLKHKPKDFTYEEAKRLLENLDFIEYNKGKTSGSRVAFVNKKAHIKIELHKPHPDTTLKMYIINNLLDVLKQMKII